MGLFRTDSIILSYTDVEAAKQWWVNAFGCKVEKAPSDWDNPLPSDLALTLPGDDVPTILLSSRSEMEQEHLDTTPPIVSVMFCDKLEKGHEHLASRGISVGPIQDGGDMEFFEIRDLEGQLIEICKER
jgi:hypothetical protein